MELTRPFQEDLLNEFKEEKEIVQQQLDLFEPLSEKLRKPAAHRVLSTGTILIFEILCYALAGGMVALAVLMTKVYPFSVWDQLRYKGGMPATGEVPSMAGIQDFTSLLYGICGVMAILFVLIAVMLGKIRQKNDILHAVGKDLKTLVGQNLKRRAAIQSIEARHFMNDSFENEGVVGKGVNDIPNPGY
jgi:hypothetical protein